MAPPWSSGRDARRASSSRRSRASRRLRLVQLGVTRRIALKEKRALLVDVGGGFRSELTVLDHGEAVYTQRRWRSAPCASSRPTSRRRRRSTASASGCSRRPSTGLLGEAMSHVGAVDMLVGTGGNVDTLCDLCPASGPLRAIEVSAAKAIFKKMCGMLEHRAARGLPAAARPRRHHRPGDRDIPAPRQRPEGADDRGAGRGSHHRNPRGAGRQVLSRVGRRRRGRAGPRGLRPHRAALPLRRCPRAPGLQVRDAALRRPSAGARLRRSGPAAIARRRHAARHRRLRALQRAPQAQPVCHRARRHHGPLPRRARDRGEHRALPPQGAARPGAHRVPRPQQGVARQGARARGNPAHKPPTRSTASTSRRSRACGPPSIAARAG